ncbi:diaminohydroxyphosphoribosylaminopyrimidine deaminase / 5-amino-6-(5-phosphoribosylamino)uracil reductase [Paenibacillus sp. UNCCL117]|uniref:bifunctional diaminohydroxyphosphoribosylaminopyrimidine deaminase/5-amino-6-(5-phosphoribosylamino)uracil reductase RibD n=1 Tax=unclassified Paenibacillus TaxID=185978 RepID=UPI00088681BB|nr:MULTISPECIES: bifunctional diaminohydroxyphosphoribosylaminopyrimidine deaminase/5-amino-6-(5-phosphoribosylamino)uracil reductase RibD [unclassified Paenibacillus]SDC38606.1 diaminohydroxyphosphoribosylaminopyrimidine deaminase / 5-amino-6-(5-phosphoribosylamino)uracil reductase [Paenibacillus sp. cl123]SFW14373.1 diaminohydroxyphosphoribosylaminopyrimidine deaminase / 5-amino-6-(5-phosphoribosylamino)uracil reductase [Paenibacillus sp. UNCCL117]
MEIWNDEAYMRLALQLAAAAAGQTGINPVVGCVLVKDGRIVGMGAHLKRGEAHAEVHALNMAGAEAEGATAYVTLEPCSHHGRTPPCSDRLIREKVRRVVVAATDPNPLVAGSGLARLAAHGVEVRAGVLAAEAEALNEAFNKYIVTRMPFVTVKSASTLDGKIAARGGDSKWITGSAARAQGHMLRHRHQAIMVGIGTVLADDPALTTRLPVPGLNPLRVVVDSTLRLPHDAQLVRDKAAPTVVLTTGQAPPERRRALEALGVEVIDCGPGPAVDLRAAMARLGEREIGSLLVEGGGRLSGALLGAGLVDKLALFLAPKIIGGGAAAPGNFDFPGSMAMSRAIRIEGMQVETYGEDICLTGYPRYDTESEG